MAPPSWIRRRTPSASSSSAGIQAGEDLVEQEQGRPGRERAGELEQLPLVQVDLAREGVGCAPRGRRRRGTPPRGGAPLRASGFDAAEHARDAQRCRAPSSTRTASGSDASARRRDASARAARAGRSASAVEPHLAGGRRVDAGEDADQRRLAGAVRPDEPDDLAALDRERDAGERVHAAEALLDVDALEQRRRSSSRGVVPPIGGAASSPPTRRRRRRVARAADEQDEGRGERARSRASRSRSPSRRSRRRSSPTTSVDTGERPRAAAGRAGARRGPRARRGS